MFQVYAIGNLGSDAQVKTHQGNEFTTFRIAHNDRWKGQDGSEHSSTTWIDCTLQGRPGVVDYLKAGAIVAVVGTAQLRTYSSPKDRCIKAGITVSCRTVELVGGKVDAVPSRLIDVNGVIHTIDKYFYCSDAKNEHLFTMNGSEFFCNKHGFVKPVLSDNGNETHAVGDGNNTGAAENNDSDTRNDMAAVDSSQQASSGNKNGKTKKL